LAAVFQPAFREEWLKLIASGERKQKSTRDVQIIRICGALVVNQENYSNVVSITDSAVSYRDVNALAEGCSDFLFWDIGHSGSDFFVIFMTRHGNALFFDFAKRVIPLIIEFSVSVLNFTLLA
jgi:hypothetical protein